MFLLMKKIKNNTATSEEAKIIIQSGNNNFKIDNQGNLIINSKIVKIMNCQD